VHCIVKKSTYAERGYGRVGRPWEGPTGWRLMDDFPERRVGKRRLHTGKSHGSQTPTNTLLHLPPPPWRLTSNCRGSRYKSRVVLRLSYLTECTLAMARSGPVWLEPPFIRPLSVFTNPLDRLSEKLNICWNTRRYLYAVSGRTPRPQTRLCLGL